LFNKLLFATTRKGAGARRACSADGIANIIGDMVELYQQITAVVLVDNCVRSLLQGIVLGWLLQGAIYTQQVPRNGRAVAVIDG
jgi:hypothetical protein